MKLSLLLISIAIMATLSGCSDSQPVNHSKINRADFQDTIDGKETDLYYLKNKNGVEISVTNFGARIVEFWVPDKNGNFEDIVLGHDNLDKYVNYGTGERFLGATIGRYGNRIAKGKFTLDGVDYQLECNNGANALHGGPKGFDMVVWDAKQIDPQKIQFTYISKDGEEGYPGNLTVNMTYELNDDNELIITHKATTDKKTIVNLTHHSFFNLHGAGNGSINDHFLTFNADNYTPVDSTLIPTGIASVEGTPFDFRNPTVIGARLGEDNEQLRFGGGYDHNWVLNRKTNKELEQAAVLFEPGSGRFLEVWTTEPGIQFYGGNYFDGSIKGKQGKSYGKMTSAALETQHYPDSPNHADFPSTVLSPGEEYYHMCMYKVGAK